MLFGANATTEIPLATKKKAVAKTVFMVTNGIVCSRTQHGNPMGAKLQEDLFESQSRQLA